MACQHSHCDQITHLSNNNTRAVIITDLEQTRSQWIREWGQGVDRIEGNGTGTDSGSSFSLAEDMQETSGGHAGNLSSNVSNCGEPSGKQHGQLALITGLTRLAQSSFISTLPSPSPTQCISLLMSDGDTFTHTHMNTHVAFTLCNIPEDNFIALRFLFHGSWLRCRYMWCYWL